MEHKHTYTTLNGLTVPIQAVSLMELQLAEAGLRAEYVQRGEPLDPPTYKIALGPGGSLGEQEYPHDENTLKTDEDKAAWAAHQDALNRFRLEANQLRGEIVFEDGILLEMTADTAWMERQRRRHIRIPEDPAKLREHWLSTEILKTADDIMGCIAQVMSLSARGAADPAAVEAALTSFRHNLSGNGSKPAEVVSGSESQEKPLEAYHSSKRTTRGKRMAAKT